MTRAIGRAAGWIVLWFDALLCLQWPGLARYTIVVVDRFDATDYPLESVRLRWRRSADIWVQHAPWGPVPPELRAYAQSARFEVRPLG